MNNILSPWRKLSDQSCYRYFLKSSCLPMFNWACEISKWNEWEIVFLNLQGDIIRSLKTCYTNKEAMIVADQELLNAGYLLLTEEQYEKLQLLI